MSNLLLKLPWMWQSTLRKSLSVRVYLMSDNAADFKEHRSCTSGKKIVHNDECSNLMFLWRILFCSLLFWLDEYDSDIKN